MRDKSIYKRALSLAVPMMIQNGITQCYSTLSLDIVAGLNISNILCNLMNVVFVALGSAVGISNRADAGRLGI